MKKSAIPPDEKKTAQEASDSQTIVTGNRNDGDMVVTFYDNDMEAKADFTPSTGDGFPLNMDLVNALLIKLNIVYGFQWETVQETILECNLNHRPINDVVIARGDKPENEVIEYYEMNPHLIQPPRPSNASRQIDYRSWSPFVIVKKNQTLARFRPRKEGKEGINTHGVALPFQVSRPEGVSGGENTRIDGKFIVSDIDGQLVIEKKALHVRNSLEIKGPVGYATGNIIFPGDVSIEGPVSDGFKIYSGGSVTIKQTFDVTDAITKGDLVVAGGIIGRGQAMVKSGGGIRTKFIENCRAAARKTIFVDSEIINSSVFTLENLEMGDKGLILGGDVYAVKGIRAGGIGKKAGKSTRIHCGIDFTAEQEKEKYNSKLRLIAEKIRKLRELMEAEDSEKRAKMEELLKRLEEEQKIAGNKVSELLGRIITDEDAAVEVAGAIIPGTLIEICQIALFVSEPLNHVRIRLDKDSRKIITEKL
ncbi:hypothetical protein AGMMS49546_23340 [Spirochaetia bacterium]|nr:hypothetical protein AGMMS49546_23340 [Spirochaetia bacterium]